MSTAVTLPQLLKTNNVISRFKEILGKKAPSFISSILTMYNENEKMRSLLDFNCSRAGGKFEVADSPATGLRLCHSIL